LICRLRRFWHIAGKGDTGPTAAGRDLEANLEAGNSKTQAKLNYYNLYIPRLASLLQGVGFKGDQGETGANDGRMGWGNLQFTGIPVNSVGEVYYNCHNF